MKKLQKSLALMLSVLLVGLLVACGGGDVSSAVSPASKEAPAEQSSTVEEPDSEAKEDSSVAADTPIKGTVAFLVFNTSSPYFIRAKEGALQAGKDLGYEVLFAGTSEVDTPKLISMIDDFVQKDVDAICIASSDTTSVVPSLLEARNKGIKVVSWDLDIAPEGRDAYAGLMDLADIGIPQVDNMVDAIGEEGEWAIITGPLTNEFLNLRIERMKAYVDEKYPKLELVTIEGAEDDPQKTYVAAQNILAAYPNVKAIMSNVSTGIGAIGNAIEDEGLVGEVWAVGQATPNLAKPAIAAGTCKSCVLWDPADWARFCVTVATDLVQGEAEPADGPVEMSGFPNAVKEGDSFYYHETITFTADNIDEFDF